jgi:FMN phosphatase YigB (HAD superfamily)
VVAAGRHHGEVFAAVSRFDHKGAFAARMAEGWRPSIRESDFYPDAAPCLAALRAGGVKIAIVGNQPRESETCLRQMGLSVDLLASSESWGVEKPSPEFFERTTTSFRLGRRG